MTTFMTNEQKYEAMLKIQLQLQEWTARQPEDHFKRYGNKDINEAVQLSKRLISEYAMEILAEDAQRIDFGYADAAGESLSISNIQ